MCSDPITIVNPRWKKLFDLHPDAPSVLGSLVPSHLVVPCGRCSECRRKRGSSWRTRLIHETLYGGHKNALFVTLTINPENYDRFKDDPRRAVRLFLERYRHYYRRSVKHWLVTELGEKNGRLHFHGILWDFRGHRTFLADLWSYGFVFTGYVNPRTCAYITKYITKYDSVHPDFVPQVFCSPGIGRCFTLSDSNICHLLKFSYDEVPYLCMPDGSFASYPRYYLDRMLPRDKRLLRSAYNLLSSLSYSRGDPFTLSIGREKVVLSYGDSDSLLAFAQRRFNYYRRSVELGLTSVRSKLESDSGFSYSLPDFDSIDDSLINDIYLSNIPNFSLLNYSL